MAISTHKDPTAIPMGPLPLYQGWAPTTDGRWVFFHWTNRVERYVPAWKQVKPKIGPWRIVLGCVADSAEEAYAFSDSCGVKLRSADEPVCSQCRTEEHAGEGYPLSAGQAPGGGGREAPTKATRNRRVA